MSDPVSDPGAGMRPMSVEEYRARELTASVRHEYVDGVAYAMSGTSRRHNRIVGNVFRHLADAAGDGPCRVYVEAVRVRVAARVFYYPDVVVACGEPGDLYEEDAPCLIVEVLSPSTEATDLREKGFFYRQKASLRAYVVVHQDRRLVERHFRDMDGEWRYEAVADDGDVPVPCPGGSLALSDVYAGVEREGSDAPTIRRVREPEPA